MEITNFPQPMLTPIQSTKPVEDGDVGQKGSFYRRNRKKQQKNRDQHPEEAPPRKDGSTQRIDIRV